MAKRLTARLSAGAALVTGLGLAGIAVSVPAQAATTLNYSCTTPLGPQTLAVALDTDAPETTSVGTDLSVTPSGTVTLNSALANGMAGALQWQDVRADIPDVEATLSDGTESATFTTDLSIARTTIFKDNAWTQDDTPDLPISGDAIAVTPEVAGTYTISPDGQLLIDAAGYTQDELNFSLFFGLAIDAYERTLISDNTPFDRGALNQREQRGRSVFEGKGKCVNCHNGPLLSSAAVPPRNDAKPMSPARRAPVRPSRPRAECCSSAILRPAAGSWWR